MGQLPAGATVAHLAYYLGRYLGCDPVVLVGQDLGFTDGQYYAAGAAIHDVWAPELNEFNTLETMEWASAMPSPTECAWPWWLRQWVERRSTGPRYPRGR